LKLKINKYNKENSSALGKAEAERVKGNFLMDLGVI